LILVTDTNIQRKIKSFLNDNFSNVRIFVFSGNVISHSIANDLFAFRKDVSIQKVKDEEGFIKSFENIISINDVVIGVGGGFVVDFVKEIAFNSKAKLIIIPTVLTNDGLASGLVVLKSVNSGKSIYRKSADYIFTDFSILNNSPREFYVSAVGELFSKFSVYNDWSIQNKKNHKVSKLIESGLKIFDNEKFLDLQNVLQALVDLGDAINIHRDSSPASGSEHLIYHALNNLGYISSIRHGIAVASISIFTLYLQNKLSIKHIEILQSLNIEVNFVNLGSISERDLSHIFEYAKNYKKDRVTILNSFSVSELIEKYKEFKINISKVGSSN